MDEQLIDYVQERTFSIGDATAQRVLLRLYRCLAAGAPVTLDDFAAATAVDPARGSRTSASGIDSGSISRRLPDYSLSAATALAA